MADVALLCSDGRVVVSGKLCESSGLLSALSGEANAGQDAVEVPLPDFDSTTVGAAVEFLQHHQTEPFAELDPPLRQAFDDIIGAFDRNFLTSIYERGPSAVPLLLAFACYTDIVPLRALCAASLASQAQSLKDEDILGLFGVEGDEAMIDAACAPFPWLAE